MKGADPRVGGVAALFTMALSVSAGAQTGTADSPPTGESKVVLEEIVVTATKRSARLQDVPVAVSAITAADIQARGFNQYSDYLNTVPGVYFEDSGPGRSQIRIRGLSSSEGSVPSTVATYFGDTVTSVLTLSGGKPNLRLVDIDRVEVLRGPQGTLFGANALAGVVRILPKVADLNEFEVNVGTRGFATAHSDEASYHVEGAMNLPLIEGILAMRVAAYKDDIAGFIDNTFAGRAADDWTAVGEELIAAFTGQDPGTVSLPPGSLVSPAVPAFTRKDINSEDTWGARASLGWQANDQLRVDLMYQTQDSQLNSEPFTLPTAGPYDQNRGTDYFQDGRYEENIDITSLTARYQWANMELVSSTGWVKFDRIDVVNYSMYASNLYGLPALPWVQYTPAQSKQFTQEVRLQSTGSNPLQWTVGVFYLDQKTSGSQSSYDLSCPACLPVLLTGDTFTFRIAADDFFNERQRALFGEVTYDLTSKWSAGVGARYFEGDLHSGEAELQGFEVGGGFAIPAASKADHEFNPSAHLRYRPTQDLTVYVQAAKGFRSGQANQPLPSACQEEAAEVGIGALTEPDTLWNYEFGAKSVLADGRVNLNLAIYRADWQGVQVGAGLACGFGAIVNGGDAIGKGVELEFVAQLARAWRVNMTAAYNHNEFDKVSPATGFVEGERLPGSFEKNGSVGVQYDFGLGELWSGFARADYVYTGDVLLKFGRGEGATFITEDSQSIGNVRVGVRREQLSIELFGRNISDERGVTSTGDPLLGAQQVLNRPREIGVDLRYSFH
jgi:outer membrane receptor protein involved in Fe transport